MRLAVAAFLVGLTAAGLASAAADRARPAARTLAVDKPVRELAADGVHAAMLVGSSPPCSVLLWNAASGHRVRVHGRCPGSPRDGTYGIAEAGARAAWIQTGGGNTIETNMLTATPARPRPVALAFEGADPGADGTYVGDVRGDGSGFFFRIWYTCSGFEGAGLLCPPGFSSGATLRSQIWLYRPGGAGPCPNDTRTPPRGCRPILDAAADVALLAAAGGRVAVRLPGGNVDVLDASGTLVQSIPLAAGPVDAALLGQQLLVRRGDVLTGYDVRSGSSTATWPVPAGAKLVGAAAGRALLVVGRSLYLVRVADGKTARVRVPGSGRVVAALTASGLFFSYRAAAGGRLRYVPVAALPLG